MHLLTDDLVFALFLLTGVVPLGLAMYFIIRLVQQQKLYAMAKTACDAIILQQTQTSAENTRLTASIAQLNNQNATKDKLFSIIGQDLKSPLLHVITLLQVLKNEATSFTQEELKKFANLMNISVKDLLTVLDNLLLWSRLKSGKAECRLESIRLQEFIENNTSTVSRLLENKRMQLKVEIDPNLEITADTTIFQTIFRNLLSMVVLEAGYNSTLWIKGMQENNQTNLEIYATDEPKAFAAPENAHTAHRLEELFTGNTPADHTRLNLQLCRDFVACINGKMSIHTNQTLKGSVITLSLPA